MKSLSLSVWGAVILAIILWGGYGVMILQLGEMRMKLASQHAEAALQGERGKSSATLQILMRETREQRATLDSFTKTDALAAAAAIEAAGRREGLTVSIDGAVLANLDGAQSDDHRAITLTALTDGEFSSLMRAAKLFESLPFPSRVENIELSALEKTKDRKDPWRMTTRIRILIPSESSN